mmetsp:Transcript_10452/g.24854  ORF Transcript_10452/g.24854 Transcript_10452/m.24854 type:complete len:617 (+) Transcript_10452:450-2300(+)
MRSSPLKDVAGKDSENASNSSSSNGEGGGNNSDNSALVSLGNTSFGFNFESDGGFNNSSGSNSPSEEGDSDQGDGKPKAANDKGSTKSVNNGSMSSAAQTQTASTLTRSTTSSLTVTETERSSESDEGKEQTESQQHQQPKEGPKASNEKPKGPVEVSSSVTTTTTTSASMSAGAAAAKISSDSMKPPQLPSNAAVAKSGSAVEFANSGSHTDAAAAALAVANLNQIATDASKKTDADNEAGGKRGLKRKTDDDSGGYNSDDEWGKSDAVSAGTAATANEQQVKPEPMTSSQDVTSPTGNMTKEGGKGKKKKLDDSKREERNAREKERSFRISKQINELRTLLSSGGVIVPKGTKSSVLTEAANYIRMLQQHQYRSEIDRHQLVQQVQRIGSGALGQQAAQAVRHAAAQNGVWSLGNFGGVPPKSAMMYHQPSVGAPTPDRAQSGVIGNGTLPNTIEESDYRHVFNSCTIGMAIASMGGAFIDCNKVFCQIANYTKQEICSMTVFNLTARSDLQPAFDLISQMLSAPLDPSVTNTSCVLRGALKHRTDVGLSVKLIKGNDGVAKCFCVTLINSPASPYDISRPIPATLGHPGGGQIQPGAKENQHGLDVTPAYTTG